jgi:hypothetical protein
MEMEEAFSVMLGSLHAVHAGRSLVTGAFAWRESACAAAARARALGERAFVAGAGVTVTHGRWMAVCGRITGALRVMENQAELMTIDAAELAAAAAADRERLLSAAAGADDPDLRQCLLAEAMEAERARRKAELRRAAAQDWWQASNDAAAQGAFLAAAQDRLLAPVRAAVADMGGPGEVAQDKAYHEAGGDSLPGAYQVTGQAAKHRQTAGGH